LTGYIKFGIAVPARALKPLVWIGTAKDDLSAFPAPVKADIGHALFVAQQGGKAPAAKPLKGFGGAGVLEVVDDHDGDTYRAVYTVRFSERVYVLHAFQKKSKSGAETPRPELAKIDARLKRAQEEHLRWLAAKKST
jgi:phage-related protein